MDLHKKDASMTAMREALELVIDYPTTYAAALAEVEEWEAHRDAGAIYYDRWKAEYDRAEAAEAERDSTIIAQQAINAQNDRLREALTQIAYDFPLGGSGTMMRDLARATLGGSSKGDTT